jgi:clathrin heavy chain
MDSRLNLPTADQLTPTNAFQEQIRSRDFKRAAELVRDSPGGSLRTKQTLEVFKLLPPTSIGSIPPLLVYFSTMLEAGRLTAIESLELVTITLTQRRVELVETWLSEDKLECSEELGDLTRPHSVKLALMMYFRAGKSSKVVECMAESGEFEQLVAYIKQLPPSDQPPLSSLLLRLIEQDKASAALGLAQQLLRQSQSQSPSQAQAPPEQPPPLFDVEEVIDALLDRNLLKEATSLALDYLREDKPEHSSLQTKILAASLRQVPHVADALLANNLFSHFDRAYIAALCETVGLTQRALELSPELADKRRILLLCCNEPNKDWLVANFRNLIPADSRLDCLKEMLTQQPNQNQALVVELCNLCVDDDDEEALRPSNVLNMFESVGATEAAYSYLQKNQNLLENSEQLTHKYLELAVKLSRASAVSQVVRENNAYEPVYVRKLLEQAKLTDALPYLILCDRFDFVKELTVYLYEQELSRHLELYTTRINPGNTPAVVAALLDLACPTDYIEKLLEGVGGRCPAQDLIEQVERRQRLEVIRKWLEQRVNEGSQDPDVREALSRLQS